MEDMQSETYMSRKAATPALTSLGSMRLVADMVLNRERQSTTASIGRSGASGPSVMRGGCGRHERLRLAGGPQESAYSAAVERKLARVNSCRLRVAPLLGHGDVVDGGQVVVLINRDRDARRFVRGGADAQTCEGEVTNSDGTDVKCSC
ncbi:hypothetical protein I4F81_004412 [Pyropia yezoensis]|uniref:Uncharacterized protein n=1 Tax=Pyropia yezoensis TaxID=2788 RepID=A0ACC3BVA3_PYRYE|nr:hypothetical protein I4F81_004412 [Neopyropia yezoensis]